MGVLGGLSNKEHNQAALDTDDRQLERSESYSRVESRGAEGDETEILLSTDKPVRPEDVIDLNQINTWMNYIDMDREYYDWLMLQLDSVDDGSEESEDDLVDRSDLERPDRSDT